MTQNGGKYTQSSSRHRRGGSHRHSAASRTPATTSSTSSTVRRTQSAFVSSTNSDVLVPSSLETFASNVDKDIDDEEEDDEKSAANGFGKKVVIKLDDSDIEETRGNL